MPLKALVWSPLSQGPAQKQPSAPRLKVPRLKVKKTPAYIKILAQGTDIYFKNTSRNLLERYPEWRPVSTIFSCFRVPVSLRKDGLHVWGPIFVAATQGIPLYHLVMEAREARVPGHTGL